MYLLLRCLSAKIFMIFDTILRQQKLLTLV